VGDSSLPPPSHSSPGSNATTQERIEQRIQLIEEVLATQPVDLDELHSMSRQRGGFMNSDLRRRVWSKFLAVDKYDKVDFRSMSQKPDAQVRCDIDRSFYSLNHTHEWPEEKFAAKKNLLGDTITSILVRNGDLSYYQGFHSVCVTCIEVCEDDPALAFMLIEKLSRHYFKDYMGKDFEIVTEFLPLVLQMIRKVDKKLFMFLSTAGIESFFATSWIITWFAHDVQDLEVAARIYDGVICSHPLFIIYLAAALVIHCREEIFELPCEFAPVHKYLVTVNEGKRLPYESIIRSADRLMSTLPPSRLRGIASDKLREKINAKQVAIFIRPPCITRYCDSDATMLEKYLEAQEERKALAAAAGGGGGVVVDPDLLDNIMGILKGSWW
jgi:hypothetical protein